MPKRKFDPDALYQSPAGASVITGLARGHIYDLCRSGKAPCIRVGQEYRICMPAFLRLLEGESIANLKEGKM